ncbi:1223_t:CDS:1 [Scutellospora calospora]|uniref:1223_t:CDS:1 n=1 Tax=Scutellospora calospora TaxID=85575 RepID=A0ACA9KKM1_9GLOM|nr:1223_t:CDS:1 [Scutellospora calospora]
MTTTTATYTTCNRATPRLILKTTNDYNTTASTALVTASMSLSSSPVKTTSSSNLPSHPPNPPKQSRKVRSFRHKHLRKPPSFDTYLSSHSAPASTFHPNILPSTPPYRPKRSSSLSSSCSSTSSEDNNYYPSLSREELINAKSMINSSNTSLNSIPQFRARQSSFTKSVRFVGAEEDKSDRSSISSSLGSSGIEDWDQNDLVEEEEEFYMRRPSKQLQQPIQCHGKFYSN